MRSDGKAAARARKWRAGNARLAIFSTKRNNAKRAGIPFSITFEDVIWPDVCPALGTTLDYSASVGWGRDARVTPSFDRLDNNRGYEPGNVVIISRAANSIKSAFRAAEIRLVADWLDRVQP